VSWDLQDYETVDERLNAFFAKYPDGSLQSTLEEHTDSRVTVKAWAFRTADDQAPGVGYSSLTIPGSTPYTKGSELENAETSARGRALVALGFGARATRDEIEAKVAPAGSSSPLVAEGAAAVASGAAPSNPVVKAQQAQAANGGSAGDTVIPLGKHKGKTLSEAGDGYARWVVDKFEAKNVEQELFVDACRRFLGMDSEPLYAGVDDSIPFQPSAIDSFI